jgi:hypothetical protein
MTDGGSEPNWRRVTSEFAKTVSKLSVIIGDNRFVTLNLLLDNPSNV